MNNGSLKIRTMIPPGLKSELRKQGVVWSLAGGLLLLIALVLIYQGILKEWGAILALISLTAIPLALLPYQRASMLEKEPDELIVTVDEVLIWKRGKKTLLKQSIWHIQSLTYIDDQGFYGIGIRFNASTPSDTNGWIRKKHKLDYFLPYFTRKGYEDLREFIADKKESPNHADDS